MAYESKEKSCQGHKVQWPVHLWVISDSMLEPVWLTERGLRIGEADNSFSSRLCGEPCVWPSGLGVYIPYQHAWILRQAPFPDSSVLPMPTLGHSSDSSSNWFLPPVWEITFPALPPDTADNWGMNQWMEVFCLFLPHPPSSLSKNKIFFLNVKAFLWLNKKSFQKVHSSVYCGENYACEDFKIFALEYLNFIFHEFFELLS